MVVSNIEHFEQLIIKSIEYAIPAAIEAATAEDGLTDQRTAMLLKNIDSIFDSLGITAAQVIPESLIQSYFKGIDEATEYLAEQGVNMPGKALVNGKITAEFKTKVNVEAVNEIVNDTMLDMAAAIRTARENFNTTYKQTLESVKDDIAKGMIQGSNREYIIRQVKNSLTAGGFTSFTTIDGKKLPMDFYARTVTRTKMRQANNHGHINRLVEAGQDLYYVTGREPTCGECAKYRGQVFSMSGDDPTFPYLDPYSTFPVHPNCQCMIRPWVEKYKTDEEITTAMEKASQFDPNRDPRTKMQREEYANDQKMKRIARQEDKHYLVMKSILGPQAPKTIGAYRNIKRNNPAKFEKLKQLMKDISKPTKNIVEKPKELAKTKASASTIAKVAKEAVKQNRIEAVATKMTDNPDNQKILKEVMKKSISELDRDELTIAKPLFVAAHSNNIPNELRENYYEMIFESVDWVKELREESPELFESIKGYTGALHFDLNIYLRERLKDSGRKVNEQLEQHAENLNKVLQERYNKYEIKTFRGMSPGEFNDLVGRGEGEFGEFRSSSIDYMTSLEFSGGYFAEFIIKPGAPANFIEFASLAPNEHEVLISSKAKFKVISVNKNIATIEVYGDET